jgi:hypothetical protein
MIGKALRVAVVAALAVAASAPLWPAALATLAASAAPASGMTLVSSNQNLEPTAHIRVQAVPAGLDATQAGATVVGNGVVSTPDAGGCTVTVGGEEKNGRWDGRSWCCVPKSGGNETCYNCSYYACKDRVSFGGPGLPPAQFEPAVP